MEAYLVAAALVLSALSALGILAVLLSVRRQGAGRPAGDLEAVASRLEGRFADAARERGEGMLRQSERVGKLERELVERMAALSESQKQSLTIADELRGLQRILKTPAQRGALGEFFLETALRNVLAPTLYRMQHTFPDGTLRADAVILYEDKLIPIDAKFSLDNYNRYVVAETDADREAYASATRQDLKRRIEETAKYVRPEDGTMDFALMFVPSEALYYDLVINQVGNLGRDRSLLEYAHEKHVVPVSPVVLYAYLQTLLQGIRQTQFVKGAEDIRKRVTELASHLRSYEEYLRKVGVGVKNAMSAYEGAAAEFQKIDKDVVRIAGAESRIAGPEGTGAGDGS